MPPPVRPRAPIPAPAKALLNGGLRLVDEALGSGVGGGLKAEVIEGFDESFDELFEKVAASVPCVAEKDAAFLRWRYGPGSPQFPVTVLAVKEGEALLGYAVLMVNSTGQDGNVLDLTCSRARDGHRRARAVRSFRRAGVQIVGTGSRVTTTPSSRMRRLGFFFRKARSHSLLVKFADRSLHEMANDTANGRTRGRR